ncbi:hypothetical protein JY96_11815 [Aquabacterium sp. NJ1]|uniref:SEL1-like repeat protein n=1 Tax=Aquabacterium sp. NJ1 TaxID=1538295 RepID=UPI00052D553B|nr:sel1 repeat family protein [Aquabacterium sp. NJ1]KGM40497.1 hypothetical protein JY96_11815 [Aquabacterium sp. NJ1]
MLQRTIMSLLLSLSVLASHAVAAERPVNLAPWNFKCTHESVHIHQPSAEVDQVFQYGRYRQLNSDRSSYNQDKAQVQAFTEIARYLRLAAAHDHPQAGWLLNDLLYQQIDTDYDNTATPSRMSREAEVDQIIQRLVADSNPYGYLLIAGHARQAWDMQKALDNYRKAAELGSPQAQYNIADWLDGRSIMSHVVNVSSPETKGLAIALYQCAAEQGHGESSYELGNKLLRQNKIKEALPMLQKAAMHGSASAASTLMDIFSGQRYTIRQFLKKPSKNDPERVQRYEQIRVFLIEKQKEDIVLKDIDQIVPLPPASLPPWNGSFAWSKVHQAAPTKPSEALMTRLSREKGLDARTGLPVNK